MGFLLCLVKKFVQKTICWVLLVVFQVNYQKYKKNK